MIDAFAGLIVGWECSTSKHTAFVERAIAQAVALRLRDGKPLQNQGTKATQPIHHSDAGSQYTSVHFTESLHLHGLSPSIGTVGDSFDTQSMMVPVDAGFTGLTRASDWRTSWA